MIQRKILSIMVLSFVTVSMFAQNQAVFDDFHYSGEDVCFSRNINTETERYNPIISGFYPDPSICRSGNDYFLVNSSFSYFPGIPVFHSRNLADWKQIGYALDRPSQLKLDGLGLSSGVYAPAITYSENSGTFYIVNTVVGGIGNFLVKTKNPFKGWSEPVRLPQVKGIDPSLFFDDDGKAYIVCSYLPKESKWYGHRSIHMYEFDTEADTIVTDLGIVVDGGVDISQKPQWLEGPHIYKVNGTYYMIMAEGGTHAGHRQVAFFSDNVKGPYKPCSINPILSQSGLDENRKDKVINVGHADIIDTPEGEWYAVFLGCRPYKEKLYNTGRETFILPVTWKDNTPVILDKGKPVPAVVELTSVSSKKNRTAFFPNGNFEWKDDFSKSALGMEWNMLRTPRDQWYSIKNGKLCLDAVGRSIRKQENPAFLGRRQQHLVFQASVKMDFSPQTEKEFAGLVLFQNDKNFVCIGLTKVAGNTVLAVDNNIEGKSKRLYSENSVDGKYELFIEVENGLCSLGTMKGNKKKFLCRDIDITHLSTHKAKGFVGSYIGMYATSDY